MKKIILAVFLLLLTFSIARAHIPNLVLDERNYTLEPVIVQDPEISYAFYGKLNGAPQLYEIKSDKPFRLYVSLLVPYVGQEETSDIEFHIMKDGEKIAMLHNYTNWKKWYEEYGGDWYLQGPEYDEEVEAGTYIIEVHSQTNSEEYSLATGYIEKFGPLEITKTIFVLPLMKALFWGNYLMLVIYLIILAFIIVISIFLIRKRLRKKSKKLSI